MKNVEVKVTFHTGIVVQSAQVSLKLYYSIVYLHATTILPLRSRSPICQFIHSPSGWFTHSLTYLFAYLRLCLLAHYPLCMSTYLPSYSPAFCSTHFSTGPPVRQHAHSYQQKYRVGPYPSCGTRGMGSQLIKLDLLQLNIRLDEIWNSARVLGNTEWVVVLWQYMLIEPGCV